MILSLLVKPMEGELLYLYLAIFDEAVSSILVRDDESRVQHPIYYVSKVLHNIEIQYSKVEKIIYVLIISTQWLQPYFQAHIVHVLIDQPLKSILYRSDTSGQMAK